MKKKSIIITLIVVIALLIISGILFFCYKEGIIFTSEEDKYNYMPITYEICDTNSCVYLLGSIHVGDEKVTKFNKKVLDLYNNSKYLAVELDTKNVTFTIFDFMATEEDNISMLSPDLQNKLYEFTENNKMVTYDQLSLFNIGYISSYLSLLPAMESGLTESGVDDYFLTLAHDENKEIIELETVEYQLNLLTGQSKEFYENQIADIIDNYNDGKEEIKKLYDAYLKGDIESAEKLITEENEPQTEEEREYLNEMYNNRNNRMAENLEKFLSEDKEVFMVVGLAHVIGEDGITNIMREKNYKIKLINS